jgi:CRISPR-associated protein Cas8a1/Csx13
MRGTQISDSSSCSVWHVERVALGSASGEPERAGHATVRPSISGRKWCPNHLDAIRLTDAGTCPLCIADLRSYSQARASFLQDRMRDLLVSGTADAGWRVLAKLRAKGLLRSLGSQTCRVLSFGTVPWSRQQKTRVDLFTVTARSEVQPRMFALCLQVFHARLFTPETGQPFWVVPQTPELIARNLAEGRAWYVGFADFVTRDGFRYRTEREGLSKMVNESTLDEERERIFVRTCHEAWRRRMGQLGERARREGASFTDLVSREFERLSVAFARCKNATTLRETVTDFWARAGGPLSELAGGWKEILPLMDDRNWRKGRDLALLALASYQAPDAAEASGGGASR